MIKKFFLLLLLLAALFLQITVFSRLTIFQIKPDIVLVTIIAIGFFKGSYKGMSFGFLGGLLEDIFSSASLGTNALSKVLCGFLASFVTRRVYENIGTRIIIIVIFSILDRVFTAIILSFTSSALFLTPAIIPGTVVFTGYNLLVGIFIFPLVKKISKTNERNSRA